MLRDLQVIRAPPRKRARDGARVAEDCRIRAGVALAGQLPRVIVLGLKSSRPFRLQCRALLTLSSAQPVGTTGCETTFVCLLATLGVQAVASWQIGSVVPLSGAPILDCSGIRFVTGMVGVVMLSALLGCFAGEQTLAEVIPSESAVVWMLPERSVIDRIIAGGLPLIVTGADLCKAALKYRHTTPIPSCDFCMAFSMLFSPSVAHMCWLQIEHVHQCLGKSLHVARLRRSVLPSHRVPQQCLMHSMSSLGQDLLLRSSLQVEGRLTTQMAMVLLAPLSALTSCIASRRPSHGLGCVLGCIMPRTCERSCWMPATSWLVQGFAWRPWRRWAMVSCSFPIARLCRSGP